jgi:transketolase N-terminal domain/subunit
MRTELEKRCLTLSYENRLSHLSSVLTSVNIIDHIYNVKRKDDVFVLGNSHAALALYAVLEKNGLANAQELIDKHGVHASRDTEHDIWVSGGSLGQAETVAIGLALADKQRDVYLLTSDGACAEGAVWEALRVARDQRLENLRVTVVANGYSALGKVDVEDLDNRLNAFYPTLVVKANVFDYPEFLQGLEGHYCVMNREQYEEAMNG